MLSYRHIYHAGNHADVLKHFCLFHVLTYYNQKQKPYMYIDTHAGAALYDLNSEQAQLNQEYTSGIDVFHNQANLAQPLASFLAFMNEHTIASADHACYYLGSAGIAALLLRTGDQLRLFERHPQDFQWLEQHLPMLAPKARYFLKQEDGYHGLIAALPPHTKRAITLIDPAYEVKDEYTFVPDYVQQALQRFPQGCYMIWLPMLTRRETTQLTSKLKRMVSENYLHVALRVSQPPADGFGMYGSQLFIINPPYTLPSLLEAVLAQMTTLLAQDDSATYQLDYHLT